MRSTQSKDLQLLLNPGIPDYFRVRDNTPVDSNGRIGRYGFLFPFLWYSPIVTELPTQASAALAVDGGQSPADVSHGKFECLKSINAEDRLDPLIITKPRCLSRAVKRTFGV